MCGRTFRCFGWILDILQRFLTFLLATVLCCALCCGCIVVLGAGIAYGYNISILEFVDLKRDDVTVFVRRGQFGEIPGLRPPLRRMGGDEPDVFPSNYTVEYEDHQQKEQKVVDHPKPLVDAWQKVQDTMNYADKLTKYSKLKSHVMRTFPREDDDILPSVESTTEENLTPYANTLQFIPDDTSTSRYEWKMRDLLHPTNTGQAEVGKTEDPFKTRRLNTKRKHKHKKKKQKPDIKIDVGDKKRISTRPSVTKFLFNREDFEENILADSKTTLQVIA